MFVLADWMSMKESEETRKAKYDKAVNPPPILESIRKYRQNQIDQEEISNWKPRTIVVGKTIKPSGEADDYLDFPYISPLLKMFKAWDKKNYGELSILLKNLFSYEKSDKKRAGECRDLFQLKDFVSYELKEVEERACSLTRILLKVDWMVGEKCYSEILEFGCIYQNVDGNSAFPWRKDGQWVIMPWDVQGLYRV